MRPIISFANGDARVVGQQRLPVSSPAVPLLANIVAASVLPGNPGRPILGLLPLLTMLALAGIIAGRRPHAPGRLRECLLLAALATGVWIIISVEFLSSLRAISFWPVLACWLIPALLLSPFPIAFRRGAAGLLSRPRLPRLSAIPIGFTVALLVLAGIVAALSPPNIRDATIYHMPRQVYWMQQHSVEHYPTPQFLQLAMPPMAEFAGLHLLILSGDDVYASPVQWAALVLAALAASLAARELGGSALAQSMAALLVVSNPMAWVQATNVKNDVVTALWLLIALCWIARIMRDGHCGPRRWLILGSAAGLAVATKLTGAIFVLPLLAVLGLWLVRTRRGRTDAPREHEVGQPGRRRRRWDAICRAASALCPFPVLPLAATILAITLTLSGPHFARNMEVFGRPDGSADIRAHGRPLTNETHAPVAIASVVIRNIALHAGTPWPRLNTAIERVVVRLHRHLGHDLNDPRTTSYEEFTIRYMPWTDSVAGAPVHLILIGATIVALPICLMVSRQHGVRSPRAITPPEAAPLALLLIATGGAFLLFCTLLKWQPWHARLHIGLLALLAPIMAVILCRGAGRGAVILCVPLMVPMVSAVAWNLQRPLIGPGSVLTTPRDALRVPPRVEMDELIRFLRSAAPQTVGLAVWPSEYTVQRHILLELEPPPLLCDPRAPVGRDMGQPWPHPDLLVTNVHPDHAEDTPIGRTLRLVWRAGQFRVLAAPDVAERLHREGLIDARIEATPTEPGR